MRVEHNRVVRPATHAIIDVAAKTHISQTIIAEI